MSCASESSLSRTPGPGVRNLEWRTGLGKAAGRPGIRRISPLDFALIHVRAAVEDLHSADDGVEVDRCIRRGKCPAQPGQTGHSAHSAAASLTCSHPARTIRIRANRSGRRAARARFSDKPEDPLSQDTSDRPSGASDLLSRHVGSTARCHFSVLPTCGFSPSCQCAILTNLSESSARSRSRRAIHMR
jgi:hypothetical protein